jgi:hypothetical protein
VLKENPRRKGTGQFDRMAVLIKHHGKTVGEYMKKGERPTLNHAVETRRGEGEQGRLNQLHSQGGNLEGAALVPSPFSLTHTNAETRMADRDIDTEDFLNSIATTGGDQSKPAPAAPPAEAPKPKPPGTPTDMDGAVAIANSMKGEVEKVTGSSSVASRARRGGSRS